MKYILRSTNSKMWKNNQTEAQANTRNGAWGITMQCIITIQGINWSVIIRLKVLFV